MKGQQTKVEQCQAVPTIYPTLFLTSVHKMESLAATWIYGTQLLLLDSRKNEDFYLVGILDCRAL